MMRRVMTSLGFERGEVVMMLYILLRGAVRLHI
jgi:hypothetical protein